jgi:hypothetical protein
MAIIPENNYTGKINPADTYYPYGSARNITLPGDGTGTPWEAALVNDLFGFQQALLSKAGITPSGDPDKVGASQYLEALQNIAVPQYPNFTALQAVDPTKVTKLWLVELHPDIPESGGNFIYDATVDKSTANAGTTIDPSVSLEDQGTGSGLGCWVRQNIDNITPIKFGAVGDGVADDTVPLEKWNYYLDSNAIESRYIGGHTYKIAPTSELAVTSNACYFGDSYDTSNILWVSDTTDGVNLFDFSTSLDRVSFKNLSIKGTHDVNTSNISAYPLLIEKTTEVVLENVKIYYSRVFGMAVRGADSVSVTGCYVHHCARDGINVANCNHAIVSNNRVEWCDDDSISVHNQYYSDQRGHVVSGNNIRFAQGIKALGAHNISISNNSIDFCMSHAINVDTKSSTDLEGGTAVFNISITGNTISNLVNRAYVDGLNSGTGAILISSESAQQGTLTAIPGVPDVTGNIDIPYPYYKNVSTPSDATTSTPIPYGNGITISGNVLYRDIDRTGLLSDLDYGVFWTRNGNVDVDLSVDAATDFSLFRVVEGHIYNSSINSNIVIGQQGLVSSDSTGVLKSSIISNNIVYDCSFGLAFSTNTNAWDVQVNNNIFDLDPYHADDDRNADGSWSAIGAKTAFLLQGAHGLSFAGNTFKNMSRITDANFKDLIVGGYCIADSNIVYAGIADTGFSTSNKGVGYIPKEGRTRLINYDGDPSSPTYGDIINEMLLIARNIPTAGTYVSGWKVESTAGTVQGTSGSQYIVSGWYRLTDGAGHVLDTDWAEMRVYTGT